MRSNHWWIGSSLPWLAGVALVACSPAATSVPLTAATADAAPADVALVDAADATEANEDAEIAPVDTGPPACNTWSVKPPKPGSPVFGAAHIPGRGYVVVTTLGWNDGAGTGAHLQWLDQAGQVSEDKILAHPQNGLVLELFLQENGDIVLAGQDRDAAKNERLWTLRLDKTGKVLAETSFVGQNERWILEKWGQPVAQTADGDVYFVGAKIAADGSDPQALVAAVDAAGKPGPTLTFPWLAGFDAVVARKTGGLALWGHAATAAGKAPASTLMWVDAAGKPGLTHTYADGLLGLTWALSEAPDNGFVIARAVRPDTKEYTHLLVQRLDAAGEVKWSWQLPASGPADASPYYARAVTVLDGGEVLIGGTQPVLQPLLVKLDSAGKLLWQRSYPASGNGEIYRVVPVPDGLLLAGASAGTWVAKVSACGLMSCGASDCTP